MARSKGSKNVQEIACYSATATIEHAHGIIPGTTARVKDVMFTIAQQQRPILDILLSIVDALHENGGDTATWKPIRDAIEAL
jgi:hypothetical protein